MFITSFPPNKVTYFDKNGRIIFMKLPTKTLPLKEFKVFFDQYLKDFVEKKRVDVQDVADPDSVYGAISYACDLVLNGGKRARPYLAYLGFLLEKGKVSDAFFRTIVALEIFHMFALIHDDVIDKGVERHGMKTLHNFIAEEKRGLHDEPLHIGEGQAVLVGDLLFSWSLEIITSIKSEKIRMAVTKEFFSMVEEVVIGQMLDVDIMTRKEVSVDVIRKKNRLKTSGYSFIEPMKIGALLAKGAISEDRKSFYQDFGGALGEAFQIQDDLLDIVGDPRKTGKDVLVDFQAGQHTYLTNELFAINDVQVQEMRKNFFGRRFDLAHKTTIIDLFLKKGVVDSAVRRAQLEYDKALQILNKADLPKHHVKHIHDLITYISGRVS